MSNNSNSGNRDQRVTNNNGETQNYDNLYRGLVPDFIISGFKDVNIGEPVFTFKWKNSRNLSRIRASIANIKYPQHVIQFYEGVILNSIPKIADKENQDSSNRN